MQQEATETRELFLDIETELTLQPASVWSRFFNSIIDIIMFYVIMMGVGVIYALLNFQELRENGGRMESEYLTGSVWTEYLMSFTIFVLYYTLLEGLSGGKTLGKLITGTRALRLDGTKITFKDAFLRSLSRMVPFEALSTFGGYPWHDTWTNTMVVKKSS